MLLLNKETIIQDIIQDMMSRNERANALLNESGHESGQSVPIGNRVENRDISNQLSGKV